MLNSHDLLKHLIPIKSWGGVMHLFVICIVMHKTLYYMLPTAPFLGAHWSYMPTYINAVSLD